MKVDVGVVATSAVPRLVSAGLKPEKHKEKKKIGEWVHVAGGPSMNDLIDSRNPEEAKVHYYMKWDHRHQASINLGGLPGFNWGESTCHLFIPSQ